MDKAAKILIVGRGLSALGLKEGLKARGYRYVFWSETMGMDPGVQAAVLAFFQAERPDYVFLTSVRSGGIQANIDAPAEFMYQNLVAQDHVIHAAWMFGVKKLLFVSGSCVYPARCPQPMSEEAVLSAPMEGTSEPYSLAKVAGMKLAQAFHRQYGFNAISVVPATIYGPGDPGDLEKAHVMGALIHRFTRAVREQAEEVEVWGSGEARREFLFVEDFVEGCLFLMRRYDQEGWINMGVGADIAIGDLARIIAEATGFKGRIVFNTKRPDGVRQKLLDSRRIRQLGWRPRVELKEGIRQTVEWFTRKERSSI